MFKNLLTASAFSLVVFPLAGMAHEKILTFDPLEDQSDDQLITDRRACGEKVVEGGIEEPHPLGKSDPLDRGLERSGTGVGAAVGDVGVGVGTGGKTRTRSEGEWALEDAEHFHRHNAWEVAMIACMQEKGYEE